MNVVELALGRIFSLMSRPCEPGDVETYERCRAIVCDELVGKGNALPSAYEPSWARDRRSGAQGDA